MINIRVRACIKCKEYIEIDNADAAIQDLLHEFEGQHRSHALVTCDHDEVPDYKKVVPKFLETLM